mmetsp:Transcript_56270/g.155754  ORF Transcript_56270/g.155754 Transcript_56270/m.155754 type:complete len:82 (-) Transcript_56270:194-439(-)
MTRMTSAQVTVERRWAIVSVVRPSEALSKAFWTSFSLSLSSADVASSRRRTLGLDITARAMAMRCRWPPLSCTPRSPTSVP